METELNLENLLAGTLRTQGLASTLLASDSHEAIPLQQQAEDHPLYWVNALRGRVTKRLMVKLQATLLAQGNAFLDQFIKYNGISCLLDVHEDLFWRTFEPKDKHKEHAIDLHEAKEAFLECTACLLPLLRRPMGLKAFTEGSKKTLHQQIVLLATSLANPEVRKVCLWAIHMIVSHCPVSRMGDLTSAFHEGLVSLQPLMAEPSIFATSLRIIAEAECTGDLESTVHALYLLNVSVEGVGDDPHESKHLKTRERMRTAFESAGLPALLDKLQHKNEEAIDREIRKWNDGKARDEALLREKTSRKEHRLLLRQPVSESEEDNNMYETADVAVPPPRGGAKVPDAGYLHQDTATSAPAARPGKQNDGYMGSEEQARLGQNPVVETDADNLYADEEDLADLIRTTKGNAPAATTPVSTVDIGAASNDDGYLEAAEETPPVPDAAEDSKDMLDFLYQSAQTESFTPETIDGSAATGGEGELYRFMKQQLDQASYIGNDSATFAAVAMTSASQSETDEEEAQQQQPERTRAGAFSVRTEEQFDLRSLVSATKSGELYTWTVRLRTDPATGVPVPRNEFDTMVVELNKTTLTVTAKDQADSAERLELIGDLASENPGGPFVASIPLNRVTRVREFEKGHTKGWEDKFGFVITYRLSAAKRAQRFTLVATSEKQQQWWMKAIVMHKALTRDWNDAFQCVMKELREQILASAAAFAEEGASGEAFTAPQLVRSVTSMDSSAFKPPLAVEMLQSGSAIASRRGSGMLSRNKDKKDRRSLSPRSTSPRTNKATTVGPKVTDLILEFTQIAEVLVQIIVDELHSPDYDKLVKPTNLGGVAGGEKYISHGILFKFARDFQGLYGGDEYAMKATQHEIKGLSAYIKYSLNSRFPNTLHFPIMTVIDYKGYRLSATSILPVGSDTLIYGSADGGKTVYNRYKEMSALMKKAGRALNIKSHWIVPMDKAWRERRGVAQVQICGPGDIEGHLGTDKRFYVLDTARVFPPTTPVPELRGSFLYRLMRPEFVKNYRTPLCSDAFSRWGNDPSDPSVLREHNVEIREATNAIVEKAVPAFAKRFEDFFRRIYRGQDGSSSEMWRTAPDYSRYMVIDMHRAGINVRYMGHLRKHTTNTLLNQWLLMEMASRVLKNRMRELMRQVLSAEEKDLRDVIATFLHRVLHDPAFWRSRSQTEFDVKRALKERFPACFYSDEESDSWDLRSQIHFGAVFGRMSRLLGLRFTEQFEEQLWRWIDNGCIGEVASVDVINQALISISPTVAQLPLVSQSRAKKFEKLADSAYATTKHQQIQFLLKAKDEYLLGLEMKTDDQDLIVGLVRVLLACAKLLQAQAEHHSRPELKHAMTVRIQRMFILAERQLKEALRIDGTRADTLATYALFLAEHGPGAKKQAKAEKYFEMALQASPYDAALQQRYRVFKGEEDPEPEPTTTAPAPYLDRKSLSQRFSRHASVEQRMSVSGPIAVSMPHSAAPQVPKRLALTVACARKLAAMDTNGFSDPYCVVTHGSQTHQTETKKKTLNPAWNETFNILVESGEPLRVAVWDWDRITKDDFIGERVIAIAELQRERMETETWYGLCPANVSTPDPSLGEIKLAFKWSEL